MLHIYNYIYLFPLCFLYQLQGFLFVSCPVGVTNIPVHYVSTQDVLHSTPVKNSNTETNIFVYAGYAQNGWKTNHENYYSLALRWPVIDLQDIKILLLFFSCHVRTFVFQLPCQNFCFSAAMSELWFFSCHIRTFVCCYDVRTFVFQLPCQNFCFSAAMSELLFFSCHVRTFVFQLPCQNFCFSAAMSELLFFSCHVRTFVCCYDVRTLVFQLPCQNFCFFSCHNVRTFVFQLPTWQPIVPWQHLFFSLLLPLSIFNVSF